MQNIEHAIILSAGLGSRLGFNIPKALVKVEGKTILEYQLEVLQNIPTIWIVVGYKSKDVISLAKAIRKDIIFVHNHEYDDGKVFRSLMLGAKLLREPYIVIEGDLIFNKHSIMNYIKQIESHQSPLNIALKKLDPIYSPDSNPIFASVENNKVVDLSFETDSIFEYAGIFYNNGSISISDPSHQYIFEYLKTQLPLSYSMIEDIVEIDTKEDII